MKLKIADFVKKNKVELIILALILLIGAFFRIYRIDEYMTFLGDEGRDVIIVRRIFTELHPPLIGPGTSIGGMYLGPLYYYLMAIPLLLANFSPVGPAVMVAILGVITIAFVWWAGRAWFNKKAGIIAAGLYAISPTVIYFSRSSWNPNIMPFFALLSVYSIWKVWKDGKFNWLIVMGISFAFVLQSHYLGLLLAPTLFVFWILTMKNLKLIRNSKLEIRNFWKKTLISAGLFLVLMSPLLFFDMRHGYINLKAFSTFFENKENALSLNFVKISDSILNIFNQINSSLIGGKNPITALIISTIIVSLLVYLIIKAFKSKQINLKNGKSPSVLIFLWLVIGIIGLGIYQKTIYDHYYGFLFPAPFLLVAYAISKMFSGKIIFKICGLMLICYLIFVNIVNSPLKKEPNKLLARSIHVSDTIKENSNGKPFNLAVIADNNYETAYKYFLLKDRYPVMDIDSQRRDTITDQLFVVCELLPNEKCDPTHSPKAEVANFGWSRIDNSWEVDGTIVYRLVHSI